MRGSGTSTNEALFSIAAYLLWRAKLDAKDFAYRGLAYELAINVVKNLKGRTGKNSTASSVITPATKAHRISKAEKTSKKKP